MKNNIVAIAGLLVAVLAAGAILHGLYERLSSASTDQKSSVSVAKELSRPADETLSPPPSSERGRDMETLIQQVSIMSQNMNTLQEQINVLSARLNAEVTGKKEEKETIDSSIEQENSRDESPIEPPNMRYSNETRDDQWASPTEAAIAAEFTTNPEVAGVTIDTIDCRSSLCRLVWQYKPDMTGEEAFATENEMLAAMNRAGFNASSQSTLGGGSNEGFFWYNPPPPQENLPGGNTPSAFSGGNR